MNLIIRSELKNIPTKWFYKDNTSKSKVSKYKIIPKNNWIIPLATCIEPKAQPIYKTKLSQNSNIKTFTKTKHIKTSSSVLNMSHSKRSTKTYKPNSQRPTLNLSTFSKTKSYLAPLQQLLKSHSNSQHPPYQGLQSHSSIIKKITKQSITQKLRLTSLLYPEIPDSHHKTEPHTKKK